MAFSGCRIFHTKRIQAKTLMLGELVVLRSERGPRSQNTARGLTVSKGPDQRGSYRALEVVIRVRST